MPSGIRFLGYRRLVCFCVLACLLVGCNTSPYMKMNPPPDADKPSTSGNNSCWLATASNMLAGAGYGNGNTVQARADDIYANMTAHWGTTARGWTDTAITWWLGSSHNTWTNIPYTVVTVYGNKSPAYPWSDANGARTIANELRRCQMVGLSINWPTDAVDTTGAPIIGSGGHAITAWGDSSLFQTELTTNPAQVRLTDSDDSDASGAVHAYTYDSFTNPNPGGANEGNGWYINYDSNHPYIKHIITLCPTDNPSDNKLTQKVLSSYQIHQTAKTSATDLEYVVGSDVLVLSYRTEINWPTTKAPTITESQPERRKLTVAWDLSEKPVPQCEWVTINTEFVLPTWNAMAYSDVHFTYPAGSDSLSLPDLSWRLDTPTLEKADMLPNVTGGYVVAAFDIVDPKQPSDQDVVARYRLVHQYSYSQSPEQHTFTLQGTKGFVVTNLRFGHSYGYPDSAALWRFESWMTSATEKYMLGEQTIKLTINWKGRLPYPKGEDITGRIADIKQGLQKRLP